MQRHSLFTKARFVVALALPVIVAAGCMSPLSSRRARVLEPGEIELAVVPVVQSTFPNGSLIETASIPGYPSVELVARAGLFDRADLQLRLDPMLAVPELAFGYQIVGDPHRNDLALTVTGGAKYSLAASHLAIPLQLLLDVPFGDDDAITLGLRTSPAVVVGEGELQILLIPGALAAAHFQLGAFFVRPELGANVNIPFTPVPSNLVTSDNPMNRFNLNVALAVDVGVVFDLCRR